MISKTEFKKFNLISKRILNYLKQKGGERCDCSTEDCCLTDKGCIWDNEINECYINIWANNNNNNVSNIESTNISNQNSILSNFDRYKNLNEEEKAEENIQDLYEHNAAFITDRIIEICPILKSKENMIYEKLYYGDYNSVLTMLSVQFHCQDDDEKAECRVLANKYFDEYLNIYAKLDEELKQKIDHIQYWIILGNTIRKVLHMILCYRKRYPLKSCLRAYKRSLSKKR